MNEEKIEKVFGKKDLEELKRHKISFGLGLMLTAIGFSFISLGTTLTNEAVRFAGLLICLGGLTAIGKRTYERIMDGRAVKE